MLSAAACVSLQLNMHLNGLENFLPLAILINSNPLELQAVP